MAIYKDIVGGSMDKNLDKHYDPKKFENRIYKAWMDAETDLSDLKQLKKREGKRGFKVEVFNLNLKNVDLQSIYSHFTIN